MGERNVVFVFCCALIFLIWFVMINRWIDVVSLRIVFFLVFVGYLYDFGASYCIWCVSLF